MSDELERRLRSSLRAYAELVDAPEGRDLPAPDTGVTPHRGPGRWRAVALAAAAAAAVVTGSLWVADGGGDDQVAATASESADPAASGELSGSDTRVAAEAPTGRGGTLTVPPSPETGVAYPLDLLTHCGVLGTDIGGVWFAADPPLLEGTGSPPDGWADPYQRGTVTLLTAEEAVFTDDAGHEVRLRADDSARPAPCD